MNTWSLADEFEAFERETMVEQVRRLVGRPPGDLLLEFSRFDAEAARLESQHFQMYRLVTDAERDAMLDRLNRICGGG